MSKFMRKLRIIKAIKIGGICTVVLAFVLGILIVINTIASTMMSIVSLVAILQDQKTVELNCEGTYDNTNCSVHIWSIDGFGNFASSASGTNVSSNKTIANGHYVGQATTGDHGLRNNIAGDQSGNEVSTSKWYHNSSFGNWNYVVRCKDPNKAAIMAQQMEYCCSNNHIGYDQANRKTLYKAAAKVGFDCSKITTNCETTCTEVLVVCAAAAGIKIKNADKKTIYCGNIISYLKKTNAFDFYTDSSYTKSYKKLKRGDFIINTGHHSCMYLSGTTDGNMSSTTISPDNPDNQNSTSVNESSGIDFTVTAKKGKLGNRFEQRQENVSDGMVTGSFFATLIIDKNSGAFNIKGTLCGNPIELKGTADSGKLKGSGTYNRLNSASDDDNSSFDNVVFTGAEDSTSSPIQKRVAQVAASGAVPYTMGWCELYVCDVYKYCGLHYNGSCCANRSRIKNATSNGNIPVGAAIYSGSAYHSSYTCERCGLNCGHVAIYIGNGKVAGAQSPKIMSLSQWTKIFDYGGYYFPSS